MIALEEMGELCTVHTLTALNVREMLCGRERGNERKIIFFSVEVPIRLFAGSVARSMCLSVVLRVEYSLGLMRYTIFV